MEARNNLLKMKDQLIFGIRPVIEAIKAGKEFEKVFVQTDLQGENSKELMALLKSNGIRFVRVPYQKLNKFTRKNHQGVVCLMALISYSSIEDILPFVYEQGASPLLLLLDGITDVRNFGAIVRTAECAGVHAVVVPEKGGAQINSDAMKTSAGALNTVPICKTASMVSAIKYLQESGLQVISCTEKGASPIKSFDYKLPTAIVLGSEDVGVSRECMDASDGLGAIPMAGTIGSLNVSVAGGMVLYEAVCQRH
jgi:23S rRNA (guanosine2251-2'-O)-methyltransferase